MDASRELKSLEAQEFVKNNGTVMRVILACHKRGWFSIRELADTLSAYRLTLDDIMDAVGYFEDMGYIKVRDIETKEEISSCDAEYDEIELRLFGAGHRMARGIIEDGGICL